MKTKGHNSLKKRLVAALLCLCMLIGLMPSMGTTAFATSQYSIGDTVLFAGYEWYIIGTETEGVTAPEGCYTLFALDNVFGRTAFAGSGESTNYKDSPLQKAIVGSEGAKKLSEDPQTSANIVARGTLDGISGDSPKNQILWPLSKAELESLPSSVWDFNKGRHGSYHTRTAVDDENVYVYDNSTGSIVKEPPYYVNYCRPAMYVKASALAKKPNPATTELKSIAFGGQWWYVVGQGANGSVPGPENTVTLFESPSSPRQSSTAREYMGSDLQKQMADFASNLTLAGKESSLIVPRTLTVADEITGNPAENQPFWPLSKFEADSIGNAEILKAEEIDPLEYYWLRTTDPDGTDLVYAVNANDGSVDSYYARYYCGVRPAFYLDISNAFYLAKDAKKATIGGNPYPLVLENYEEYKYTIFDGSLALSMTANPTQASQTGDKLSFGYVATTGENLYLACVLTADGDNNILYYNTLAELKESSASSGTVDIPLTGVTDGDYTLRLYTEQKNSRSTDFASPTVDVSITVNDGVASIRNLGDVQLVSGSGGQDGREVELRTNDTHIQWRYAGEDDNAWRNLVALDVITGSDGADGREVELHVANGYIQWRYTTGADTAWKNLTPLSDLKGDPGEDGDTPYIGSNGNWWIGTTDTGIKANGTDGSNGSDGKDGQDGEDGLTPNIGSNGNWWIGDVDTGIKAAGADGADGEDGTDGTGVANIALNEDGELIVTLTDGTESNLGNVKGEDGVGISGVSINENGKLIVTLTDGTELNAGAVPTVTAEDSDLRTLVYISMGVAGVSLAGLIGLLAFLLTKHRDLFVGQKEG